MLSDSELQFTFGIGIHVLIAGGLICTSSVVIKLFSPSSIWAWGIVCVVIGLSLCISALFFAYLNSWRENKEWEKLEKARTELVKKRNSGCAGCKSFYNGSEIHCAVHPYGKAFEDCKDYE